MEEKEYLYERFRVWKSGGFINTKVPYCIEQNLRQKFLLRPYQKESFCWFDHFFTHDFENKQPKPYHLLFNMATGSGKTLIMAGLILYLYENGYRNFLFFVNSTTIIDKTKDNFLNKFSSKYLFAERIKIGLDEVHVNEVDNFDGADKDSINIKFTTIQKLHISLVKPHENELSYGDFEGKKIVLIADEADNLNAATRGKRGTFDAIWATWENTVSTIHKMNEENILLDFTATMDFGTEAIKEKFRNKTIYRYDLAQFRKDGYSKEISVLQSDSDDKYRVIQALILNLYRQQLASSYNVNLKPVILLKSKNIADNIQNKSKFQNLIESLSNEDINKIRSSKSNAAILNIAFSFFDKKGMSNSDIVRITKQHFQEYNIIGMNDDIELEKNQILLNSLEDENNPIRAVFAVNKLDRGWDVLNLFDIVRMYDTRDAKGTKVGATTRAEAQLIGRGARYFPFKTDDSQEKFMRKYDNEDNELKILETLYYHSKTNSRYISELTSALVESGIMEAKTITKHLRLKDSFKTTDFYRDALIITNQRKEGISNVPSMDGLSAKRLNYRYKVQSVRSVEMKIMRKENETETLNEISRDYYLDVRSQYHIPWHIQRYALTTDNFFRFDKLKQYYPEIKSSQQFLEDSKYLGHYAITFYGEESTVNNPTNRDYLDALKGLLNEIKKELSNKVTHYEVSIFNQKKSLQKVFVDKDLKFSDSEQEKIKGQEKFLKDKDWYAYNANYGTSEEKAFVEMFARRYEALKNKYDDIYLMRNELFFKIYDKYGNTFQPDFVLYVKDKANDKPIIYQIFIEPKGQHINLFDKWKENFMKEIKEQEIIYSDRYYITAIPIFYTKCYENDFEKEFNEVLNIS